jgi:hypothetical protein
VRECLSLFYWVHRIHDTDPGWKYYISYCVFLVFEVVFVYFIFPETSGRSLEELAFCTFILTYISPSESADFNISVRGQYTRTSEEACGAGDQGRSNSCHPGKQELRQGRCLPSRECAEQWIMTMLLAGLVLDALGTVLRKSVVTPPRLCMHFSLDLLLYSLHCYAYTQLA